jgi:hypothetical protein
MKGQSYAVVVSGVSNACMYDNHVCGAWVFLSMITTYAYVTCDSVITSKFSFINWCLIEMKSNWRIHSSLDPAHDWT